MVRIENWNGYEIRFVEKETGEWWAVAADVCKVLGLKQVSRALSGLKDGVTTSKVIDQKGREQEANILNEKSIYKLVFKSKKKEAESFQDWVFEIIKNLRQSTGLESFQVFRMLDKEHQREAMSTLKANLIQQTKVNYIKANTIANKAVSSMFGHKKMIKKEEMSPEMLVNRQQILDDTVNLMSVSEKFNLNLSVSQTVYNKYLS